MKDARGHGSNGRGGALKKTFIIPSKPYRQGSEHQHAIAEQHGIPADHLQSEAILRKMNEARAKAGLTGSQYAEDLRVSRGGRPDQPFGKRK